MTALRITLLFITIAITHQCCDAFRAAAWLIPTGRYNRITQRQWQLASAAETSGDQDILVSSNKQLDKMTAQQFSIQVCTSTNCCRKMNQLGLDQYHMLGELYEKARLANIEKDMIVEDGGCRGGKNCKLGPCVAVMHEDFDGSVALEGMGQSEFNERVFHGVATQDDVERVWSCITNAIELMTVESDES